MRMGAPEVVCAAQAKLGECPVWDEQDRSLLFVDILGRRVHRLRPDGVSTSFATPSDVGCLGLGADGRLVLALADGFCLTGADGEGPQRIGALEVDPVVCRFNDGEVDPWGRFVAGTVEREEKLAIGALYALSPDGSVTSLLDGLTVSNGLAWSEDRGTLYFTDSPTHRVDTFRLEADGLVLADRREFVAVHGCEPDGIALDADGCLWVACWGGGQVRRFTPDGRLDTVVELPTEQVTSVAFGGPGLEDLYVTTARVGLSDAALAAQPHAGDVFVVATATAGRPPGRFG
jgi:sugar lactone lactonase YvrE